MRFVSARDFRVRACEVWERMVVSLRRARAQLAVSRMRQAAAASGADQMTAEEIEAEIARARAGE